MLERQQSDGACTEPPFLGSHRHALQRVLTESRACWQSQGESMLVCSALQYICICLSC